MSIWEAFGMGRHKGFSREAGLLLDEAVELAGSMGCARADTGHLLLAMLQIDRTSPSPPCAASWPRAAPARPASWTERRWPLTCAGPWIMPSSGHRTPTCPRRSRSTCSAPCWRIPTARRGCCWPPWGCSWPRPCGSAVSSRGSSSCPARPGPAPCPGAAAPAISIAATSVWWGSRAWAKRPLLRACPAHRQPERAPDAAGTAAAGAGYGQPCGGHQVPGRL